MACSSVRYDPTQINTILEENSNKSKKSETYSDNFEKTGKKNSMRPPLIPMKKLPQMGQTLNPSKFKSFMQANKLKSRPITA
jgi:hypothetical protein